MKRIFLVAMMIAISLSFGKAQTGQPIKKVAILEVVDRDNSVNYGVKLLLRTCLAKAITQTHGYEGYDRVDMGAIQGEQDFQRTGMVSDAEIRKLGEMTGAAYVLVAEVAKIDAVHIVVTAKILNVESAKLERTDLEQTGISSPEMERSCRNLANRLLNQSTSVGSTEENSHRKNREMSEMSGLISTREEVVFKGFNLFWEDNSLHRKKMNRMETQAYLGDGYKTYLKSIRNKKIGVAMSCIGGVLAITGTIVFIASDYELGAGVPVWGAGAVCLGTGIPLWVIANKKIREVMDSEYGNMMGYQTKPVLSIGTGEYGFGLNFRF